MSRYVRAKRHCAGWSGCAGHLLRALVLLTALVISNIAPVVAWADEAASAHGSFGTHSMGVEAHSIYDGTEGGVTLDGPRRAAGELPSSFDLRAESLLTEPKAQGPFGTCWSFAAMGSAESSLLQQQLATSGMPDLSERHLLYFTYHTGEDPLHNLDGDQTLVQDAYGNTIADQYLEVGGNAWVAGYTLSSWVGAADEATAPYDELVSLYDALGKAAFVSQADLSATLARTANTARLRDVRRIALSDESDVKSCLMSNGAASISMDFQDECYNEDTYAHYCTESGGVNHSVLLVGWDDNFPAKNFTSPTFAEPDKDGYLELPDTVLELTDGATTRAQIDAPNDSDPVYLRFVPAEDASYQIEIEANTSAADDELAYGLEIYRICENGLLAYVDRVNKDEDATSLSAALNLKGGETYYLALVSNSAGSYDISLTYDGPVDEASCPSRNGAWLVRNSWGSNWGDGGYFWVSYDDAGLKTTTAQFFIMDVADAPGSFEHNYQHDGSSGAACNMVSSGGSVANVYRAQANEGGAERLRAVGLWLNDVNVQVKVQIYTDLDRAGNPTSGIPALSKPPVVKTSYEGYYTIDLPENQPVYLREGSLFAVVLTLSREDGRGVWYGVDASYDLGWIRFESAVAAGKSFECDKAGAAWDDLATCTPDKNDDPACCARIKAFTSDVPASEVPLASLASAKVTLSSTKGVYMGKPLKPVVTSVKLDGKTLKATDYTVSYVNNTAVGKATVKVTAAKGSIYTGSASTTFTIKRNQTISAANKQVLAKKTVSLGATAKSTLTYKSSNTAVATVSAKGVVTGKKAGTVTITISAQESGSYWAATKQVKVTVKLANPLVAKAKKATVVVSAAKVKVSAQALASNIAVSNKSNGRLTYANASSGVAKQFKVNAGNGKVGVPKNTKPGTYTVKVKVTSAARGNYVAGTKTVSFKVWVK